MLKQSFENTHTQLLQAILSTQMRNFEACCAIGYPYNVIVESPKVRSHKCMLTTSVDSQSYLSAGFFSLGILKPPTGASRRSRVRSSARNVEGWSFLLCVGCLHCRQAVSLKNALLFNEAHGSHVYRDMAWLFFCN